MSKPEGKAVFLYPGQGEMRVGIAHDFYMNSRAARKVFDLDKELKDLCFFGPSEVLNNPYNNQAANYLALMAITAALSEAKVHPAAVAGQSLGEYAALSCADSLTIQAAIPMLKDRARIMTDHIPVDSGMCAILGLDTLAVEEHCADVSSIREPCQVAIYSTPDRNVIAGTNTAIEQCAKLCRESGAKTMPVQVARAFHTSLSQEAKEEFEQVLREVSISEPRVDVYYNFDGSKECDDISKMLAEQLVRPVQLIKVIDSMLNEGFTDFVKIGGGGFFGDAVRSIASKRNIDVRVHSVESFEEIGRLILNMGEDHA